MSLSTLSLAYSYDSTYENATAYTAKNTAAKMLVEDMAAATIPGLTYDSKVSPDVTTSAQTFSVKFKTTQNYFLEFGMTTASSGTVSMTVKVYCENGIVVSPSAASIGSVINYTSPVAEIGMRIYRYFSENIYDIYSIGARPGYSTFYPYGAVYLTNKGPSAPVYACIYCSGGNSSYIHDTTNNAVLTTPQIGLPDGLSGMCVMIDTVVGRGSMFAGTTYIGTLKNCKSVGIETVSSGAPLVTYTINGSTYIRIGHNLIYLKVT